jgi:leader peptidase (prepilin peptidase)/N-methyltransferase
MKSFAGAALGYFLFYSLAWIYQRLRKVSGLGGGDVKFLAAMGAFVGPQGVIATIFISSIAGSLIGLLWAMLVKKENLMKVSIPYGPFLVLGALCYYLLGDLLSLS